MSSSDPIGFRGDLELLFDELAEELGPSGAPVDVVMVGGGWLLWHASRATTRDVDSARPLTPEVVRAVQRVASRHDLADDWLNDRAAAFWPADASTDDCQLVYEMERLTVRTPPPEVVFVMKLYRAFPQDFEDMVTLWPRCTFTDGLSAAAAFRAAFPHAPEDEHLAGYIDGIARIAAADNAREPPTDSR